MQVIGSKTAHPLLIFCVLGGRSALMIACISNSLDVAKLLIENQAKLNFQA